LISLSKQFERKRLAKYNLENVFPKIVGAVDGCQIQIQYPKEADNPKLYMNRKGFYAICLMAVVDATGNFISFTTNTPGSVHDSTCFKTSALGQAIKQGLFGDDFNLVGDAAFKSCPDVLTPFDRAGGNDISDSGAIYNYYCSLLRTIVEQAFGFLHSKFGILSRRLSHSLQVNKLIVSCTILLHNYIRKSENTNISESVQCKGEAAQGNFYNSAEHQHSFVTKNSLCTKKPKNLTDNRDTTRVRTQREQIVKLLVEGKFKGKTDQ